MQFHVAITTCNREKRLRDLIEQLRHYKRTGPHSCEVWLYNDGREIGEVPVTRQQMLEGEPHGKELYWKVMRDVWVEARQRVGAYDAFLFVQDDVVLPQTDFLNDVAALFQCLDQKTHRFAALNLYGDGPDPQRRARWTGAPVTHSRCPEAWSAKWVDLQCVCFHPRAVRALHTIESISQGRWIIDPTLSSGVGRQISRRLWKHEMGQYMVTEPWVKHVGESLMNPLRNGGPYS